MRLMIVSVNDYSQRPGMISFNDRECVTKSFAQGLGVSPVFAGHDGTAYDQLFQISDKTPAAVEVAHVVYFAGHGTEEGLLFGDDRRDNGIASYPDMKLGQGGLLALAVFDCCKTLLSISPWKTTFGGLHYMLSFGEIVHPSALRGKRFAEVLRTGLPFPRAWRRAAIETESAGVPWHSLRAVKKGATTEDDIWSEAHPPLQGPTQPYAFVSLREYRVPLPPTASPPTSTVRLFRLRSAPGSGARLVSLAGRFGMALTSAVSQGGWSVLRGGAASLEVAEVSDSIWWSRPRNSDRPIFEPPPYSLPSRDVAITKAKDYLKSQGLDDPRLVLHSLAKTEEVHESLNASLKGQWDRALHVNYTFELGGLPVFGPGAKLQVTFESEQVDEFFRFWREPELEDPVPIVSPQGAEEILRSDPAFIAAGPSLHIRQKTLGYLALPPTMKQDKLIPVYKIEGRTSSAVLTQGFVCYVQAIPEDFRKQFPEDSALRLPNVL